jgi:glycosyltransferase involved in cell wall biosynthesis
MVSEDVLIVAFADVKRWAMDGTIVRYLFRYAEAELLTHSIAHISKPFLTALLLRLLSHGRCFFSDDTGNRRAVGGRALFEYLLGFLRDLLRIPLLLAGIRGRVGRLGRSAAAACLPPLDLARSPLYLRTDLLFGVESGGSVGHIAGVLNHLDQFTGRPIFITTDPVPTVRSDIETHVMVPGADFCGFPEIPDLHFNRQFTSGALALLAGRPVSFVYQRYGLNNFSGLELSRRLNVPFVLEYNGSQVWISRNWGERLKHETIARRIETVLLRAAQLVVVVSRPTRDELVAQGIPDERILLNPNGVDPDRYSPTVDGQAVRQRHGLGGKRVLGFIGTFGRWHGAEVLADAFGRLMIRHPEWRDSVRLLMIGDGLTMPEVKAKLEQCDVRELVVLTGIVPQAQGPSHLAACDLFVSPHVRNPDGTPFFGSPTKVFEYMAMARGIIASNLGQIGEILRHGETAWMVEPGDVEALVSAMEHLLRDDSLARRLGDAARREVVARYTWREHARRIVEALRRRSAASAGALEAPRPPTPSDGRGSFP